ncbi:MAG: branched-chain amino acid ABC transporter permease [Candidatus Methylomirabilia bacterium]
MLETAINILSTGAFHASILFLIASGLQVVFGVQKIFNLACGSAYALGAYVGVSFVAAFFRLGAPSWLFVLALIVAGIVAAVMGPLIERGLLRFIYNRPESFQLLLTFAVVLIIEDLIKLIWGFRPLTTGAIYLQYGSISLFGATVPVYNLVVIFVAIGLAFGIEYLLLRTNFGRVMRGTASDGLMSQALGVNIPFLYVRVFTLGTLMGTLGGALQVPATQAVTEMGVEAIVLAFAVVVIGGLGSMRGALLGALIVGLCQAFVVSLPPPIPEAEVFVIYAIVIVVLLVRPRGLLPATAS